MSMQIVSGRADSITPFGPRRTASTLGVSVTQVITTSASRAASAGVSAQAAPASMTGWALLLVREWTMREWPALRRFSAMGAPMIPVPMNAMFCWVMGSPFALAAE